jgi:hypothetical protein
MLRLIAASANRAPALRTAALLGASTVGVVVADRGASEGLGEGVRGAPSLRLSISSSACTR